MSYLSGSLVCQEVPAAAYWARSAQDLEKVRENLLNFKAAVPKRRYYTRPVGLEFFISYAFLGIRIPSSMWEQRCGNRQSSKAAVYSRYDKTNRKTRLDYQALKAFKALRAKASG